MLALNKLRYMFGLGPATRTLQRQLAAGESTWTGPWNKNYRSLTALGSSGWGWSSIALVQIAVSAKDRYTKNMDSRDFGFSFCTCPLDGPD